MKQINTLFFLFFFGVSAFAQTESFIENSGSTICYTTFGKGFPVLIINGGPGMSSEGFVSLAKTLSENNKTIIYDQRGTGKSTLKAVNETTITLDLMVEDIESLRKHLKIV
ncbi:MAG TPA: alpha/beta hydrolase, partial [Flavobacteriaceae bacterium]|nr:alpha/beta hydrolase [Flavobacteriaceae bacterium]